MSLDRLDIDTQAYAWGLERPQMHRRAVVTTHTIAAVRGLERGAQASVMYRGRRVPVVVVEPMDSTGLVRVAHRTPRGLSVTWGHVLPQLTAPLLARLWSDWTPPTLTAEAAP